MTTSSELRHLQHQWQQLVQPAWSSKGDALLWCRRVLRVVREGALQARAVRLCRTADGLGGILRGPAWGGFINRDSYWGWKSDRVSRWLCGVVYGHVDVCDPEKGTVQPWQQLLADGC